MLIVVVQNDVMLNFVMLSVVTLITTDNTAVHEHLTVAVQAA